MQVLLDTTGRSAALTDPRELTDADLATLHATEGPWLRATMVSTVDGSATGEPRRSGSIGTPADRRVLAALRSWADVVVVGAGTARAEGYRPGETPILVVSRTAMVPESLRGAPSGSVLMATCALSDGVGEARALLGEENVLTTGTRRVDLTLLKRALVDRGWERQLAEGGPRLLRDLVVQGAADELAVTTVPRLVAGDHPRIAVGAPIDRSLRLTLLLEDSGTLLGRWLV